MDKTLLIRFGIAFVLSLITTVILSSLLLNIPMDSLSATGLQIIFLAVFDTLFGERIVNYFTAEKK